MKTENEKTLNDYEKETLIRFILENLHFGRPQVFERLDSIEKYLRIERLLKMNEEICEALPGLSSFEDRRAAHKLRRKFDKNQKELTRLLALK